MYTRAAWTSRRASIKWQAGINQMRRSSGKSIWAGRCGIVPPSSTGRTSRIYLSTPPTLDGDSAHSALTRHCTNPSLIFGNMERSSQRVIHAYAHVRTHQVLYSFTPYIHVRFPVRQSPLLTSC
jgi:hypothetical protein